MPERARAQRRGCTIPPPNETVAARMLARLIADGQLALPKALLASFPGVDCFSATEEDGRIVLSPVRLSRAGEVRKKLEEELGIAEANVKDAVV